MPQVHISKRLLESMKDRHMLTAMIANKFLEHGMNPNAPYSVQYDQSRKAYRYTQEPIDADEFPDETPGDCERDKDQGAGSGLDLSSA